MLIYCKIKNVKINRMLVRQIFMLLIEEVSTKIVYHVMVNIPSKSWETIKDLNPDILIRIRDDAKLTRSLNLNYLFLKYKFNSSSRDNITKIIITPTENRWGGINDKFAIVSKSAIEEYLIKPFEIYNSYKKDDLGKGIFNNPEKFLSRVYSNTGISLFYDNIKIRIVGQ